MRPGDAPPDSFYFHTDVTVQTFVRTVILWMSRSAPLQIDAQSYPPGRQSAQSQECIDRGKRRAVVAPDPLGQTVMLKEPLKRPAHRDSAGVLHCSQFQNVAGIFIAHWQRFAAFSCLTIPPAFEIHCPHLVRGLPTLPAVESTSLPRRPPPHPPFRQSRSFQHPFKTALARRFAVQP